MNVEIVNTGSELMLGRVLNTHQQWLCRRLADLGHVVTRQVAVADTGNEIQNAVREALARAELVITTGGLGPTSDDITRELIAQLLGRKLVHSAQVQAHIEAFFAKRGRPRPNMTDVETFVPEGSLVFLNQTGTAPGLAIQVAPAGNQAGELSKEENRKQAESAQDRNLRTSSAKQWLIMLPGPPRELRPMFDDAVVPLLRREFAKEIFVCRTLRSTGIGESRVQEMIEADVAPFVKQGLQVGYCARPGAVDVRLVADGAPAPQLVQAATAAVELALSPNIYGYDDDEIEAVVVRLLTEQKKSLALAESCTGGNIGHRITNVPGASTVFFGGVTSYANSAKEHLLGVRRETLLKHGAVSEPVAREMAAGAREKFQSDFALAVTGIAGPDGGTPEKPVGTVFIALATADGVTVESRLNPWDRITFKDVTATQALELLRRRLL
jgi:nicotinamide-nucleotide amidase